MSKWIAILFFLIFSACEKKDKQNQISLNQKELATKGVNFLNISKNLLKILQHCLCHGGYAYTYYFFGYKNKR